MRQNLKLFAVSLGVVALASSSAGAEGGQGSATRYPIVLSHHWSGTAYAAFRGNQYTPNVPEGERPFPAWGVKHALERDGAVVYQPDKLDFGSNENRGRLLYRKCAGATLSDKLCQGQNPQAVDGVELAMLDYCGDPAKHRGQYPSIAACLRDVKINVICHSQGCPDSRYMINAMTNRLSGRPMHEHVASWTSIAGANKGTAIADVALGCTDGQCGPDYVAALDYLCAGLGLCSSAPGFHDSVVALSRKYMTQTMDMSCNPATSTCPPSFNRAYPNPPNVYWQSYSGYIRWAHSCYSDHQAGWLLVGAYEGLNDGYISLESQRFLTAGPSASDPPTRVHDRGIVTGTPRVFGLVHPGISHMGFSNNLVPGLPGVDCPGVGNDEAGYAWDREAFYVNVARDLRAMGF